MRLRGAIALAEFSHDAVEVRNAGLHAEVVHLVVQQKPRAFDHDAAAEPGVQRVGVGDCVAPAIDDREVRRGVTLQARSTESMVDIASTSTSRARCSM